MQWSAFEFDSKWKVDEINLSTYPVLSKSSNYSGEYWRLFLDSVYHIIETDQHLLNLFENIAEIWFIEP